jgi:uncharacterized membrane protein
MSGVPDNPSPGYSDAANFLKAELARTGIGYDALCQKLKDIGVEESYKGVANKINRGSFSFAFFMQCMKAINQKTFRLEE